MIPSPEIDAELGDLWQMSVDAFAKYNIVLKLPKHTDRRKTYQWRYLAKMNSNFKKWNLEKDEIKQFLSIAVDYARHNRIAFKGLSLFHQTNILQVCYDKLVAKLQYRRRMLRNLRDMKAWFAVQTAEGDVITVCLRRANNVSMCNLAKWYQSAKINPLFMALTKPCMLAMDMVGDLDKALLPSKAELVLARQEFLSSR